MQYKKYILNCFILLIPILLWNIILADDLPKAFSPEIFSKNIPRLLILCENSFRIVIMVIPLFVPLSIKSRKQKIGLTIYFFGTSLYFLSWILLIVDPVSNWSQSIFGFMAPAITPFIWLFGIGLIGHHALFKNLSLIYITLSSAFIFFHSLHTYIVFQNL